jgi:hypothetical protein
MSGADQVRDVGRQRFEVSGQVATITGSRSVAGGIARDSSRTIVTSGCVASVCVMSSENRSRSTAKRGTRRHVAGLGRAHDERSKPPHLFLQQADCIIELVAAQRVAADEFRETIRLVHGGRPDSRISWSVTGTPCDAASPGGFGTGEPAANDDGDQGLKCATTKSRNHEEEKIDHVFQYAAVSGKASARA